MCIEQDDPGTADIEGAGRWEQSTFFAATTNCAGIKMKCTVGNDVGISM
jgi:hypothetical protein